ncbi:MAG: RNA polymerase subunit sigma-70 [Bryobacterales bacterium]|nr:RNA polymerase subunit sigma-70 [Bryobacterales bacterium]
MLRRISTGDSDAFNTLMPFVYDELKRLAYGHLRRESDAPMEPTTLVHEVYLKLVSSHHPDYESRKQFYCVASRAMRQVLVDNARSRLAQKRGSGMRLELAGWQEFGTDPDRTVVAVNDALERLAKVSATKARLVEMRYFGGLTAEDCALLESMSVHVVRKELRLAHAWLKRELSRDDS